MPDDLIHRPWQAPADVLKSFGVELGVTYPPPIVDFRESRAAALTAYARPEESVRALRAGFDLHLAKPVREEALLAGIVELRRKAEVGALP